MHLEQAEHIAVLSLSHLASETDKLQRFLQLTGIEASEIRTAAQEPAFLAGVIGFFMANEKDLLSLADALNERPQTLAKAYQALGGQQEYDASI
jgi:hypothetical protein